MIRQLADMIGKSLLNIIKIRFHVAWSLVFCFWIAGCSEQEKHSCTISIHWENKRAKALIILPDGLPSASKDAIDQNLQVKLANSNTTVLGEFRLTDSAVIFQPLIPLTRGLIYHVNWSDKLLGKIEIPTADPADAPRVVNIYPGADTVPLNLLKIYIEFSKPMREGQAAENIIVIKNDQDTLSSVFLDLDPELWNNERNILTLWLDPGRIKRDLQPNKRIGPPLDKGASYQLLVEKDWQDSEGVSLVSTYIKEFSVATRDALSPDPSKWKIHLPKSGTNQPLMIYLYESLDYLLLKNAVRVVDSKGEYLPGNFKPDADETILNFTPALPWKPGEYTLEVEARLEDLAGNNLERLFDKDLTRQDIIKSLPVFKRGFLIP